MKKREGEKEEELDKWGETRQEKKEGRTGGGKEDEEEREK